MRCWLHDSRRAAFMALKPNGESVVHKHQISIWSLITAAGCLNDWCLACYSLIGAAAEPMTLLTADLEFALFKSRLSAPNHRSKRHKDQSCRDLFDASWLLFSVSAIFRWSRPVSFWLVIHESSLSGFAQTLIRILTNWFEWGCFFFFSASVNNKAHYPRCSRPALQISVWIRTSSFVSGPSSPRQRQPPPQQLHLKNECLCAATAFAFNYIPFFRKRAVL